MECFPDIFFTSLLFYSETYLNWHNAVTMLWWVSMTPLGKPVVPLENGMVARSSNTLRETVCSFIDSPNLIMECHCESSLFALLTTIVSVLCSFSSSWESIGTNSGVQIHKSALLILETCLSSPIEGNIRFELF